MRPCSSVCRAEQLSLREQDELMKIPVNELMCLFDADQTCSRGFFDVRPSSPPLPLI